MISFFDIMMSGMATGLFIGSVASMIYHLIQSFINWTK